MYQQVWYIWLTGSFKKNLVRCSIILSFNNTTHQQNAINNLNLRWSDAPNKRIWLQQ